MIFVDRPPTDLIVSRLESGSNVALHSAPGCGKSTLLSTLAHNPRLSGRRLLQLNAGDCQSGLMFMSKMLSAIGVAPRTLATMHTIWQDFSEASTGRLDLGYILLVDEFDAVVQYADRAEFLRLFREIVSSPNGPGVSCLVASRRTLSRIEEEAHGISTLESVFEPHFLPLFDIDEVLSLSVGRISADAALQVLEWSGGVPNLVARVLESAVSGIPFDVPDEYARQVWIDRFFRFLQSSELWTSACQTALGPDIDVSIRDRLMLESISFLPSSAKGTSGLASFPWLRRSMYQAISRKLDPWSELGRADVLARDAVAQSLTARFLTFDHFISAAGPRRQSVLTAARANAASLGLSVRSIPELVQFCPQGGYSILIGEDDVFTDVDLSILGGLGVSPGMTRAFDRTVLVRVARDISALRSEGASNTRGTDEKERPSDRSQAPAVVNYGTANVSVATGTTVVTQSSSSPKVRDRKRRPWAIIGSVLAALASIATLVGLFWHFPG